MDHFSPHRMLKVIIYFLSILSSLAIQYCSERFLLNAYELPGLDSDVLKSGTHRKGTIIVCNI